MRKDPVMSWSGILICIAQLHHIHLGEHSIVDDKVSMLLANTKH